MTDSSNKSLLQKIKNKYDEKSCIDEEVVFCEGEKLSVLFVKALIDAEKLSSFVLEPIKKLGAKTKIGETQKEKTAKTTQKSSKITQKTAKNRNNNENSKISVQIQEVITLPAVEISTDETEVLDKILSGYACVVCGDDAFCYPIYSAEKRSPEEPPTSRVIKGPREGFVEDIGTNISLVRKRLKTPNLQIEDFFIGKQTKTKVSVVYLEGIAKAEVVEEVALRLKSINIDAIIDAYYIQSFLEGDKIKFFKRVGNTEKPDIFCAKLLEGRVGLMVDGSPIMLTVPFVLFEDLQSSEDYYTIPAMATFARIMRLIGLIFAILIPGVYVALQSYNYRILPINFLISLLSSIEGLSIPPLVELLVVLFLFEVITEASLQMPNSLGMALSIIGALALGNTAVDAGIISPPSIVVVAISSVALYIIPDQISETRILRLLFTVFGGVAGLYGVVTSFIIMMTYLTSIKSFGVPYFAPYAPSVRIDKKDGFVKRDVQSMTTRPKMFSAENFTRQKYDITEHNLLLERGGSQKSLKQSKKNSK